MVRRERLQNRLLWAATAAGLAVLSGCLSADVIPTGDSTTVVDTPADESSATHTVCDPFTNDPSHAGSDLDMGIVGKLQYLTNDMPRYTQVSDYLANGVTVDATLYLNQVYIPTRAFDLGFVTQSGVLIQNADGNNLYEYFSLQLESELRLGPSDPVGNYQFALLADDGANLYVDSGNGLTQIVNDDGTHSTKLMCATQPVSMDLTSSLPMRVDYYQGPRYHIALMVLWRPWPTSGSTVDPLCGKSGNSFFFDSTQVPSAPTSNFNALLSRGWKVLTAENYALPRAVASNPCTQADPVRTFITTTTPSSTLTNSTSMSLTFNSNYVPATFQCSVDGATPSACTSPVNLTSLAAGAHSFQTWATDSGGHADPTGATFNWTIDLTPPGSTGITLTSTSTSVTMNWTTSEPATTKLLWGATSDTPNVVPEDSNYVTSHSVTVTGLTPNTLYFFKGAGHDQAGNAYTSSRFSISTKP